MAFKDRLKEVRVLRGLKQRDLAEKIGGITGNTISNYEKGVSSPSVDIMKKIFDVLEVTPNYMFQDSFNTSYNEQLSLQEISVIKKYRELDKQGKEIIDYLINVECNRKTISTDEYITEVAARGDSKKKVNIRKDTIRKDLENYTPPDEL